MGISLPYIFRFLKEVLRVILIIFDRTVSKALVQLLGKVLKSCSSASLSLYDRMEIFQSF